MFPLPPYVAEFLGSFAFILSIFLSGGNPLIIGGALAAVIYLIGAISGGHVNPAVSFAMMLNGDLSGMKFASYVAAQLLGGAAAYYAASAGK
jgi:aquaporin Z